MPTAPVSPCIVALACGRSVELTPATKGFPDAVRARILADDPAQRSEEASWKITNGTARTKWSNANRVSEADTARIFGAYTEWVSGAVEALEQAAKAPGGPAAAPLSVEVAQRRIDQPNAEATTYLIDSTTVLLDLLRKVYPDSPDYADLTLYWPKSSLDDLAVLDLDFHDRTRVKMKPFDLEMLAREVNPAPLAWWMTQGGGLHMVYARHPGEPFTAEELAAGAAALLADDPQVLYAGGTVEVITRTRHPGAPQKGQRCGQVHLGAPTYVFGALARLTRAGATDDEVEEVLESKGWAIGERLAHDCCPIDPGHASTHANPVIVTPNGLRCFSCESRLGDGFRSWGSVRRREGLTASQEPEGAPIVEAAKHLVHFHHARYMMGVLAPHLPRQYHRPLYSALAKHHHRNDARVGRLFTEFAFVRGQGCWLHADTLEQVGHPLGPPDVKVLPSVLAKPDEEGECEAMQERVTTHTNNGNVPGWMPLVPTPHTPVYFHHNCARLTSTGALRVIPERLPPRRRVQYREPKDRIALKEAERRLLAYFPGVSLRYLRAILCVLGCGESGIGKLPILWATGETGSSKTTAIKIITEMLGDRWEPLMALEPERFGQAFGEAASRSRLVVWDDFAKDEELYADLHAFILHLDRAGLSYHKLHVGPQNLPLDCGVILTDWNLPAIFTADKQWGRRVHLIRLEATANWEAMGHLVEGWPWATPELTDAAETFFSCFVDDYFGPDEKPADTSFEAKMKRLGINLLCHEQGQDVVEQREARKTFVRALVKALAKAPDAEPKIVHALGKGFQAINWGNDGSEISGPCTTLVKMQSGGKLSAEALNRAVQDLNPELHKMFRMLPEMRAKIVAKDFGAGATYVRLEQDGLAGAHNRARKFNRDLFPDGVAVERPEESEAAAPATPVCHAPASRRRGPPIPLTGSLPTIATLPGLFTGALGARP